jgi:hypothetical protein
MTISTALAATAAIAVGTLGAVTAYQVVAPPDAGSGAVAESAPTQRPRDARQRFAPCERSARLEAGRCVTERTRMIKVPGGTGPAPTPLAVPPSDFVDDHGDDDGYDHGGDRDDVADELEDQREDREDALEDLRDAREDAAEDRADEREDALEDARDDD